MRKKQKQRLALWFTGILLIGLLPVQNIAASKLADASEAEAEIGRVAQTDYGLQNPRTDNGVTTWDCVYFGNYWQEDTNGDGKTDKNDGKTPIKWRVLSVDGDDAFLLAENNLDCQSYNSQNWQVTWDICTMRSWLNGYGAEANKVGMDYSGDGFVNNAFTESERQLIKTTDVVNDDNLTYGTAGGSDTSDQVYLLSLGELTNPAYGFISSSTDATDTRMAENTAYTAAGGEIHGDMQSAGRTDFWWSRSPGRNSSAAVIVHSDGKISDIYYVNYTMVAVRPALHLNLAASPESWSNAGIVTAGKPIVTPTPAPTQAPARTPVPTVIPTQTPARTPVPTVIPTQTPARTPVPTAAPTQKPEGTPDVTATASPEPVDTLASEIKEVSVNGVVKFVMPQQMAVTENIEKFTAVLPRQVTVTGQNGQSAILPVGGDWVYNEAGACWKNSADAAQLPSGLTDEAGVLSDISISFEVGDNQGLTFEMSGDSLDEMNPSDGEEGKITIKKNRTSEIDVVILYQITKQNGTYTAESRYEKAVNGEPDDKEGGSFVIHTVYSLADTGDYVAVGYTQQGGKTAYLSDSIVPLLVTEHGENGGGGNGSVGGTGNTTGDDGKKDSNLKDGNVSGKKNQDAGKKMVVPKVGKVKKYKVKTKKKSVVLTWKKGVNVSRYQVQIGTKKNFKGVKYISIKKNKTKYKISKLKPGKRYYIRIRACKSYKGQDGKKREACGKWSVKRVRIPK